MKNNMMDLTAVFEQWKILTGRSQKMGYEIKLYIGESISHMKSNYSKLDGKWIQAYKDEETGSYRGYLNGEDEVSLPDPTHEAQYLMEIASLDICKTGYESNIMKLMTRKTGIKSYGYFTGPDGGDVVDCYDDFLLAYPINDVLLALTKDRDSDTYRRFNIAVDILTSIKKEFKDAHVVLYGH